jgi:Flp pilus assembly protein CpaB
MSAPKKPKKVLIQFAIALIVAILLGIGAVFVGFSLISGVSNRAATSQKDALKKADALQAELEQLRLQSKAGISPSNTPQGVPLLQASTNISPGIVIRNDMLTLVESQDPAGQDALHSINQAVGKMVKTPVTEGQFLKPADLIEADSWLKVPPGQRAITIRVDASGNISGAVMPGARVDVLATVPTGQAGMATTRTILQNALIMRVENPTSSSLAGAAARAGGPQSAITLMVTPKQAEAVTLAGQIGAFHLTLRNGSDTQTPLTGNTGLDTASLLNGESSKPKVVAPVHLPPRQALPDFNAPRRFSMEIYRGSGAETVQFHH